MRPLRGSGSRRGTNGVGRGRGFGGGGGLGGFRNKGPPKQVVEHTNASLGVYQKVDEIFGPINESLFSRKMMEGIVATSYSGGDKFYINPEQLLLLARFLPQPKGQGVASRGRGCGGARGGRGRGFCGDGFRRRDVRRGRGVPPRGGRGGGFSGRGRF
ncbi:hypothetical protein UlMin_033353 [Ulmus minor]